MIPIWKTSMELESTTGVTVEYIKVTGLIIKCMERENLLGQMARNTSVNIRMIKKKDLEFSFGLMEENTKAAGKMVNNMAKANYKTKKERNIQENGLMARKSDYYSSVYFIIFIILNIFFIKIIIIFTNFKYVINFIINISKKLKKYLFSSYF